jgi:hypothetical protein
VGRGHLRGDHPDRGHRCGDLPGSVRNARHTRSVSASLPVLYPLRGHADAGADRDAEADREWQGHPGGHPDRDAHTVANSGDDADPVQPGAAGLPDAATATDRGADADSEDDSDCGGRNADTRADRHPDPDTDHSTELNTAANRHADPFDFFRLTTTDLRGRRAACSRSPG